MDNAARRIEKRNRPPVSCEPCRSRKLKCNRGLPCDTCVKRNKSASCHYAPNANRVSSEPGSSKGRGFKDRLDTLESLVSSFASRKSGTKGSPPGPYPSEGISRSRGEDMLTPETPHLQESDDGQVNYIDPSHWQSILEDIREVREHFSPSKPTPSSDKPDDGSAGPEPDPSLLFGSKSRVSMDDVLSSLPSQPICDMLLSRYFGARFMVLGESDSSRARPEYLHVLIRDAIKGIVHPHKFQNEYKSFWGSPASAPPLWTALLFSILSITATLRQMANPAAFDDGSVPAPAILQEATVQCLVLGRYATANAYVLEAFLLHLQSCFLNSGRPTVDPWFEMGTIIRLAFRMGYHRDPSNLPGVSTFDGEMRRRVWLNIVQIDALMSFHMGFPTMISSQFCDAEDPRNLEYSDLQVDMTSLPPARPFSEHTPVIYTIVKSGVMGVFKKIVSHTQLPTVPPYSATLALEAEMRRVYGNVPEQYQRRDVNRSFTDPSTLILERCTIEILYLKGIIVLLRRFISYDLKSSPYESSRRACVEAALDMLARQADVNKACEPGGRLYEDRWMLLSIPPQDYLLAAMVICLDLSVHMRSDRATSTDKPGHRDLADREYRALQTACQIWSLHSSNSREMRTAAEAINLMITKVAEKDHAASVAHPASFVDMTSADGFELPYAGPMSQMIDGSEAIDWSLLDQYFQGVDVSDVEFTM